MTESSRPYVPQLVSSQAVPSPHIDAIASGDATTYAAGRFDTVTQGGTQTAGLGNIVAFSTTTGAVKDTFNADISGQVWDLELDPTGRSLWVAGDFASVNGQPRAGLVKLDAATGATIDAFKPYFSTVKVNDVQLVNAGGKDRLIIGGGMPGKLVSVDPVGGKKDGYVAPSITNPIPGAWGGVAVYRLAVNRGGDRLVATGNFQNVNGQSRTRLFVMNLGPSALLSDWYYKPFAKPCATTAARRVAYLQGVDWSPRDPNVFTVAATGQIPAEQSEIWHRTDTDAEKSQTTVCDAVGRFSLANDQRPEWINYTGGDSVWRVQDTGAAVYAMGHFQWLDNPNGYASNGIGDKETGEPAARRLGIGAIHPETGRALAWDAPAPSKQGGKALVSTTDGLWLGTASKKFDGKLRFGLAFAPLP